ncbi:MAG: peptidase prolyl oligopeptidase active site domain protein, partial [Caulobacteraceae bacterium]|nr:peptidase prolyl oligopeptidase active site domain protein [Caulobacteraceae bacterium]
MRVGMWLAGLAVSLVGMAAACAAPLEAYGRLPTGDLPEISPDGTKIAAVITNDEGSTIIVTRLADNKLLSAAQAGRIKVRYLRWAGPENVLIITSETQRIIGLTNPRDEYLMVQNLDLTTNRARPMMTDVKDKETMNVIRGEPDVRIIDGQPAVLVRGVAFNGDRGYSSVFRLGVKTNSTKVIAQGGPLTRRWIIGQDGDVLAQSTYDDKTKRWALKAHGADGWREVVVVDTSGDEDAGLVGLGRTPDTLLIWTSTKGVPRYEEVQVAGGARKV